MQIRSRLLGKGAGSDVIARAAGDGDQGGNSDGLGIG